MTRRRFIRTCVVGTGAWYFNARQAAAAASPGVSTFALRHRRAHPLLREHRPTGPPVRVPGIIDVVIVGAGPAGLVAAWSLAKRGREVLVLDAEPATGGAARTMDAAGTAVPLASTYFARRDGMVRDLLADIGATPVETAEDAQCFAHVDPIVDFLSSAASIISASTARSICGTPRRSSSFSTR